LIDQFIKKTRVQEGLVEISMTRGIPAGIKRVYI
jgi:hypothetical protein